MMHSSSYSYLYLLDLPLSSIPNVPLPARSFYWSMWSTPFPAPFYEDSNSFPFIFFCDCSLTFLHQLAHSESSSFPHTTAGKHSHSHQCPRTLPTLLKTTSLLRLIAFHHTSPCPTSCCHSNTS